MKFRMAAVVILLLAQGWVAGAAREDDKARELLDAIREDLVELRFEKALAGIEALLGEPEMSEAERAEALVLRAQAHVAFGDLDGAEEDYREILLMRPAYEPDVSLTPNKAMVRFEKVRDALVGRLRVKLVPPDAGLSVDGSQVVVAGDGTVALLAGEHQLRAFRAGYDPVQQTVAVKAGEENEIKILLLPNSRTVILRTEQDGVRVLVDGIEVGETATPQEDDVAGRTAELVIENLPLGEHLFQLQKECYREEWLKDVLTADLMESAPKIYQTISMAPASATLAVSGGPAGAELLVDGSPAGRLPCDAVVVCPGERDVAVSYGGRTIWREALVLREAAEVEAEVTPRPTAALVGASVWPAQFTAFAEEYSTGPGMELPAAVDISQPAGWAELELPENTDLALGVVAATRQGAPDQWYLYSPILRAVQRLDGPPLNGGPPRWLGVCWGLSVTDSEIGGRALVVGVSQGSGAEAAGITAGDRITEVGGIGVSAASEVRTALAAAQAGGAVEIGWVDSGGHAQEGRISGTVTPLLTAGAADGEMAIILAAWAPVDALCDSEREPAALANLALLFSSYGHHELSADTWRRVHWVDRSGIGEGTKQYYLGVELEKIGKEDEAMEAYRRAAASAATAFNDEGPKIGPAAEDRLADLGVASSAP